MTFFPQMELTNDIQFLLPIMVAIMISKWVGDFFTHPLYHALLELKCIPFLASEPVVFTDDRKRWIKHNLIVTCYRRWQQFLLAFDHAPSRTVRLCDLIIAPNPMFLVLKCRVNGILQWKWLPHLGRVAFSMKSEVYCSPFKILSTPFLMVWR